MLIVKMMGGMGNQLFQYALYLALRHRGELVKIDDSTFFEGHMNIPRERVLENVFGITYEKASPEEIRASRAKKEYTEKGLNYNKKVFRLHHAYLSGYWQTEKYFSEPEVTCTLRAELRNGMERFRSDGFLQLLHTIKKRPSVSIHIRRTDYLSGNAPSIYGGICTEDYYEKAIAYILEKEPGAACYVFSDDKDWAASRYTGDNYRVVGREEALSDAEEFFLMSSCSHHILANSSFSWWAAWLDDTFGKITLAPGRWINGEKMTDIYTPRMTILSSSES